jgi:hypothetical protein
MPTGPWRGQSALEYLSAVRHAAGAMETGEHIGVGAGGCRACHGVAWPGERRGTSRPPAGQM